MFIFGMAYPSNLQKSFVLPSANQMAEPSGALQGHFVRSRSISSRITSGLEDKVARINNRPVSDVVIRSNRKEWSMMVDIFKTR